MLLEGSSLPMHVCHRPFPLLRATTSSVKPRQSIFRRRRSFTFRFADHYNRLHQLGGAVHLNGRQPHGSATICFPARVAEADVKDMEWDEESCEALLRGGEEVAMVLKEVADLLEDIADLDKEAETAALQMAVTATIGKQLEKLDGSFLLGLDWMITQAERDGDTKKLELLQMIKEAVLSQLTKKLPSHVQVVSMLCTTATKEHRHKILLNSAAGGGTFKTESGNKLVIPKAKLNDIAHQADNILATMEEKPVIKDRRLLAKLVLIREEARGMMSGGLLDERNDNRGLKNLPEREVNFLAKLVALRPGSALRERIANVMNGLDEGVDHAPGSGQQAEQDLKSMSSNSRKHTHRAKSHAVALPVRPGMFLDAVTKVLNGLYRTGTSGVTVQHLEWVYKETLDILQGIAFI